MVDWKSLEERPYKPLAELSREVAADGAVLLKNKDNVLPLSVDRKVSVFGRTQINYYKCGTGSGGAVHTEYEVNILEGLLNNENINVNTELVDVYKNWIKENPFDSGDGWTMPWAQLEMVPDEETVKNASEKSDTAVIVIGRTAGECKDASAEKGSWFLSEEEEQLLEIVSKYFDKTVAVLNVGNIIDMNWVDKYDIKSVLYVWQGGQEGGNAVADVLSGAVNPSGKLADTIAYSIEDYPAHNNFGDEKLNCYKEDIYVGYRYFETFAKDRVMYPFGFGLSYTEFTMNTEKAEEDDGIITIDVSVKNTGERAGREVVQVYFEAPQGKLGKSARELCGFAKTAVIQPGETETVSIKIKVCDMAAYDDSGISGHKACYVLEAGRYNLYAGRCVRCAEMVLTYDVAETIVTEELEEAMAPELDFEVMYPDFSDGKAKPAYRGVSKRTVDYNKRIAENLPKEIPFGGDKGIKLSDVKSGKNTMEEFVSQMNDEDLRCIITGEGMCSPKSRPGNTGVFGGVTKRLDSMGVPVIALCDGPSGIRMDNGDMATSMPNGTLIACTWDTKAAEKLYEYVSIELCVHHFDSLLGPGMNIHRYPLNGRNFEYMSEDPYLTGKICAALVRGVGVYGNSATIKHFAANNQELNRYAVDSVVSERALREIYLKAFEIAVKEGNAKSLMTSYNPINGHWAAVNYELNTVILRQQWGYDGFVMTDWGTKLAENEDEGKNLKAMAEAQNDVFMLASDALSFNSNIDESLKKGTLTRGQLQRNAINLLNYIMNTHSFEAYIENGGRVNFSLAGIIDELNTVGTFKGGDSGEDVEISVSESGKYLVAVDCITKEDMVAQYTICAYIDNKEGPKTVINCAPGEIVTAYFDYTFSGNEKEIRIQCPPIRTTEIRLMK